MTKKLVKAFLFAFLTLSVVSCGDDDDKLPPAIKVETISYSPNKAETDVKKAFSSSVAVNSPTNAKVTFAIKEIKKGSENFSNPDNGFEIDANSGKISLKENHPIAAGVYNLKIEGTDLTKHKATTSYEVTVKSTDLE